MDELLKVINVWIGQKVDALAATSPRLVLFAPRIKQGLSNILRQYSGKIEPLLPFITDEDGRVNIGSMRDEILAIFGDMPKGEYQFGEFTIYTDKASVKVQLPQGQLWGILFGDLKTVKFGESDVEDLIDLFNSKHKGGVK
jgi:hypothetical protein